MQKLIFIFCLLFTIPAHSFQTIRAQNTSYSSRVQQINYIVACKRPSKSLFKIKERYVRSFANKYKKKTLDKHLQRVILCKDLRVNNAKWVRGTYDMKSLTLFIEISKDHEDTEYALHHEFSSILLLTSKNKALRKEWTKHNRSSYGTIWGRHVNPAWSSENKMLREKGFLFPYSTTDFENDFNVMASFHMCSMLKYTLYKASKKYPLIKKNMRLLKSFIKSTSF